jgi:hypothetical protein
LIAACRSTSEWKTPRCNRRRVIVAKKPSTALVAMPRHALADHGAVEDIERGKQRGRAVPDIIMGLCPGPPLFHRQAGWVRSSA